MIKKISLTQSLWAILLITLLVGCGGSSSSDTTPENNDSASSIDTAYLASTEEHYKNLGLKKDTVEVWEDALRTDGKSGSFEWWYSDFLFSDGTSVVVIFYTKFGFDTYGPAHPMVSINVHYPDGTEVKDFYSEDIGTEINASKTSPDIHIGKSYLTYKEGNYLLHFEKGELVFDAKMLSVLPMTRPKTGYIYFGKNESEYLAWLPAQISSNVQATLTNNGQTNSLLGLGYHDHNWGNRGMYENINSWYWGRSQTKDYTIVFFEIIANKDLNNSKIPLFIVAKGDKFIEMNSSITFQKNNIITHPSTNKKYANSITVTQTDVTTGTRYSLTSSSTKDLVFLDMNKLPFEMGNSPTYIRRFGDVNLTITESNGTKTVQTGKGIVEQMSFDDTITE